MSKGKCKETLRNRVFKKKLGFHPHILNMSEFLFPKSVETDIRKWEWFILDNQLFILRERDDNPFAIKAQANSRGYTGESHLHVDLA